MKLYKKAWYTRDTIEESFDFKKIAIIFMFLVYPLIVVPNSLGYFYFPRYIILALLSIISIPILFRDKIRINNWVLISLFLFIIFSLISTINSKNPETAWIGLFDYIFVPINGSSNHFAIVRANRFTGFLTYIFCMVLFLISYKYKGKEDLLKYMLITALIVSIIALLQFYGFNIVPHEAFRNNSSPYGTIGNSNFLGTYLVFILPAAINYYLTLGDKKWIFASAIIYSGILAASTRGVWIAIFIVYIIFLIYVIKNKINKKLFIKLSLAFLLCTLIMFMSNNNILLKRALSIPENVASGIKLEDNSGTGRMKIWKDTIKLLPKYWAFGVGPDNLIYEGIKSYGQYVGKAHNIYLEILITMGSFAFTSYIAFLSFFIRPKRAFKDKREFVFFTMIIAYLIQGFFNIDVIMVLPLFWIVLGLYLSYINEKQEQGEAND